LITLALAIAEADAYFVMVLPSLVESIYYINASFSAYLSSFY